MLIFLSTPYNHTMKDILSARLKAERERAGLTQADLGNACKNPKTGDPLSGAAVSQWEDPNGTTPTLENLLAISRRMGASIDYLTGLVDRKKSSNHNHVGMAREESAQYHSLTDEAIKVARQWQSLPPGARATILNLLETMKNLSGHKRG